MSCSGSSGSGGYQDIDDSVFFGGYQEGGGSVSFASKMNCPDGEISCRPPSIRPPTTMCCGMPGSVCIRLPNCNCCLPMCCPPEAPQCPTPLCCPPPTCGCGSNAARNNSSCGGCGSSNGGDYGSSCGYGCNGGGSRNAPCSPKVILTKECPKKPCCPIKNKNECPDRVTWPDPPKIDMCCSTSCPQRRVDICYMKVCPSPARCCPPNYPCAERSTMGQCCNWKRSRNGI